MIEAAGAPLALFGRNLPVAALIPLTILWFGIDETQKVMFIFIACVPFVYLDAVAAVVGVPFVLVVNNDLPARSVQEFIALAKSKPGEFSYGSTGPGTPFHLYAELFSSMTGIQMVHIPYKAAVAAQVDLMGGRLQVMMTDFTSSLQLIREGKIRALGVTTKNRADVAPEIAPIAELGVPGFDASAWQMVVAPAATPKPVVDKLHAELKAIMAMPETRQAITRIGLVPVDTGSPEELQGYIRSEIVRWGDVVRRSGASVE